MPDANSEKPLCLDQFLKLTGIAGTGGQAKLMIQGGGIVQWGETLHGQLDNKPSGQFQAISAGTYHSLGVTMEGEVIQWGDTHLYEPGTPPSGQFQAVSAGAWHSLGLTTNGEIRGWGASSYGQTWQQYGQFQAIAAGGWHSLGLRANGQIVGWGCKEGCSFDATLRPVPGHCGWANA